MLTSPAWLTSRSSSGARTRTEPVLAHRLVGLRQRQAAVGLETRPVDVGHGGSERRGAQQRRGESGIVGAGQFGFFGLGRIRSVECGGRCCLQ